MLLSLFQYDFMIRALVAGFVISLIAPAIGSFLVFRRYSYLADTLGHVSLLGVVLGVLFGVSPIIGALVTSLIFSFGIDSLRQSKKYFSESILSLFMSGSLALALILSSFLKGFSRDFMSFLFGSITTVTSLEIWIISFLGLFLLLSIVFLYRKFFLITLDEDLAEAEGLNIRLYNFILIFLSALTVSISLRIVGVLLIGALMVIPVMTALRFGFGFLKTILLSIFFSCIATLLGLFLSVAFATPSGPMIVVVSLVFFLFSLLAFLKEN
jgi:zinc transport system permease protein